MIKFLIFFVHMRFYHTKDFSEIFEITESRPDYLNRRKEFARIRTNKKILERKLLLESSYRQGSLSAF